MTEIAQVISTVGFPIAAFLLMFWFCKDTLKTMQETLNSSLASMQSAIQENTRSTDRLIAYMEDKDRSDIDGK